MSITLGSLFTDDLKALQELDLLPSDTDAEALQSRGTQGTPQDASPALPIAVAEEHDLQLKTQSQHRGRTGGLSWFEELLEGSRLGHGQKTRRGQGVSADGSTRIEWEVSEYFEDGTQLSDSKQPTPTSSKRKLDEIAEGDDVKMHG